MGEYPPEAARLARQVVDIFSDPESFPGRVIPPHIAALLGLDTAISATRPHPTPTASVREEVPREEKRSAA